MLWLRRLLWSLCGCVVCLLAVSAAIAVKLVEGSLHLPRRPVDQAVLLKSAAVTSGLARWSTIGIRARDGVALSAWYLEPVDGDASERANHGAVLLLHGQGDNREGVLGYGEWLVGQGYSVLLPDARDAGDSGGGTSTYGVLEGEDVRGWANWLEARTAGCTYGLGESMGAAQLLSSLEYSPGFCAVVAESSFATLREIFDDRLAAALDAHVCCGHMLSRATAWMAVGYLRMRYGLQIESASPMRAVRGSRTPILLIHGGSDEIIPVRHSMELQRANPAEVTLWVVPGAEHCDAWQTDPHGFEQRVLGFFEKHRQRPPEARTPAATLNH